MMAHASDQSRQERFVPTLTDVVEAHDLEQLGDSPATAVLPPALVSELAVSEAAEDPMAVGLAASAPAKDLPERALPVQCAWSDELTEQMVHRVIQRVDILLTQRVGEVVAAVVEAQTRTLLPSICQELEFAIRNSVNEALANELSQIDEALKSTQ